MFGLNGKDIFLLVAGAILGAFASVSLELFLPDRMRLRLSMMRKLLSKFVWNPSYLIGITSRLDCKKALPLDAATQKVFELFAANNITRAGSELHFQKAVAKGQIDAKIQFGYDENPETQTLLVESITVTVQTLAPYRSINARIEDLRAVLSSVEDPLVRELSVFAAKRELYIEVARLEEFSEWLENLEARQITGKIRNLDAEFSYYENRLVIEDTIDSATINWLKHIVVHVG